MDDSQVDDYDLEPQVDPDEGAWAEQDEALAAETVSYRPAPARQGLSPWLIALIVVLAIILVCCVCVCLGGLLLGPAVGDTFSTIIETLEVMTPVP